MVCPTLPNVALAIETILLFDDNHKLASKIKKAPKTITTQQPNNKNIVVMKSSTANTTGKASIPAPMEVPAISKILPINRLFIILFF